MQIFMQHQGQQTGPFPIEQVRSGLADGTYQPTDLAWHEGAPEWMPLSVLPGITDSSPPSLPGTDFPPTGAVQTSPLAIWSLVLGLLSFILLGLTAIPAVICGHLARGQIKRSNGALTGGGLALGGLITGYLMAAVVMLALTAPSTIGNKKGGERSEATNNLRQLGLGLAEFKKDYGKYPNDSTAAIVAKNTGTEPIIGNSSNAYFRQLIRAGIIDSEQPFYARTQHSRKPDNETDGNHALGPGECAFAYISNVESSPGTPRPLAMAPLIPGTTRFDPQPFGGTVSILWTDGTVRSLSIDRRTGAALLDGTNLFDSSHPVWGGKPPVIALPE